MTIAQALSSTQIYVPDVVAIQADMEQTRTAFHDLLGSLSEAELEQPCIISKWTVKEVMYHLVICMEQAIPMMVGYARKGKNMPKFFETRLGHWLNYKMAVWGAKKATPESLAQRYDKAHEKLLALLEDVRDDEWTLPTAYSDGTPLTMETVFHVPTEHFEIHAPWVRQTIGQ